MTVSIAFLVSIPPRSIVHRSRSRSPRNVYNEWWNTGAHKSAHWVTSKPSHRITPLWLSVATTKPNLIEQLRPYLFHFVVKIMFFLFSWKYTMDGVLPFSVLEEMATELSTVSIACYSGPCAIRILWCCLLMVCLMLPILVVLPFNKQ